MNIVTTESKRNNRGAIPDIAEMDEEKSEFFEPSNDHLSSKKASNVTIGIATSPDGELGGTEGDARSRKTPRSQRNDLTGHLQFRAKRMTADPATYPTEPAYKKSGTISSNNSDRKQTTHDQMYHNLSSNSNHKSNSSLLAHILLRKKSGKTPGRSPGKTPERTLGKSETGRRTVGDKQNPLLGKIPPMPLGKGHMVAKRSKTPGDDQSPTTGALHDLRAFKKKAMGFDDAKKRPGTLIDLEKDHIFIRDSYERGLPNGLGRIPALEKNTRTSNSDGSSISKTNIQSTGGRITRHYLSKITILNPLRLAKEKGIFSENLIARRRHSGPMTIPQLFGMTQGGFGRHTGIQK